jgi:hypothetical protein
LVDKERTKGELRSGKKDGQKNNQNKYVSEFLF